MDPVERVIELTKAAEAKLNVSFDAPDVLPFAEAALKTIESHPELRAEFEQAFLDMPTHAPREFVEVCMPSDGQASKQNTNAGSVRP